jgi:DNA polymerase-4
MSQAILHLDMDAFYASVEQRDHPSLRGRPVIVGGHPRRGVVVAASYEARPFGIRSAMPMVQALRLLPDAIVVSPRMDAYVRASEDVFAILASVTPLIEPLSLDEAFLDVTGSRALFGSPFEIATRLRERILQEVHLPSSAGIATVKFVAKMATDFAKPNGQKEVPEAETIAFLAPLPIGRLWGVGKKTEEVLHRLNVYTIGDLARQEPQWLETQVSGGQALWALSHGLDPRMVVPDRQAKSLGAEDTFEEDLAGDEALFPHLHSQALRVGRRLRAAEKQARVVQIKIKLADFTVLQRQRTLSEPTDDGQTLYRVACELVAAEKLIGKIRLTGVSAHDLEGTARQLSLFDNGKRARTLNVALDRIAERFGADAVKPADLNPRATLHRR